MIQLDSNRIRTPRGQRIPAHLDTDYQQVTSEQSADPIQKIPGRQIGNPGPLDRQYITICESADPCSQLREFLPLKTKNGYVIVG